VVGRLAVKPVADLAVVAVQGIDDASVTEPAQLVVHPGDPHSQSRGANRVRTRPCSSAALRNPSAPARSSRRARVRGVSGVRSVTRRAEVPAAPPDDRGESARPDLATVMAVIR
jgi:hypothetical protein